MMSLNSNENSEVKLLGHRDSKPTQNPDYISLESKHGMDIDNEFDLQSDQK